MSSGELDIRRILMALDASSRGRLALDLVLELVKGAQVELQGLFVEDINLLRLAALPFAREISRTSTAARPLEPQRLEQLLRYQAENVEKLLAECAGRAGLPWSFRVVRGRFPRELEALAGGFDLCIVGCDSSLAMQHLWPRLPAAGRPVVVSLTDTPAALRALRVAHRLARCQSRRLLVLSEPGWSLTPQAAPLHEALATAEQHALPAGDIAAFLRSSSGRRPVALVLAADHPLLRDGGMEALLRAFDCPLLLVR
ncbi:MAG TPA: hypothetical protein VNJ47_05920 [Nevskiales bacterium]|nr:hypothetical protein [Nevskiales bacterium]